MEEDDIFESDDLSMDEVTSSYIEDTEDSDEYSTRSYATWRKPFVL